MNKFIGVVLIVLLSTGCTSYQYKRGDRVKMKGSMDCGMVYEVFLLGPSYSVKFLDRAAILKGKRARYINRSHLKESELEKCNANR